MSTSDRKYHRGDVPERVLSAARELLDRQPATEISVRELARSAGVSHAAPYRHFGDREGLLVALAAHCFREFIEAQRSAYDAAPPAERLLAVGLAYVDYAVTNPNAFAILFDPNISPANAPPESHLPLIEAHAALLSSAISDFMSWRQAANDGETADLGAAMWSAAHGLGSLIISGRIHRGSAPAILSALLT